MASVWKNHIDTFEQLLVKCSMIIVQFIYKIVNGSGKDLGFLCHVGQVRHNLRGKAAIFWIFSEVRHNESKVGDCVHR